MAEQPPPSPSSPHPEDRRKHPRHRPLAQVEFAGGGEVAVLPIVDISAGGIRLEMATEDLVGLEIDEPVDVFLEARPPGGPIYVTVPATVVRIQRADQPSVALEWRERTPAVSERFDEILGILQGSGTPD